MNSDCESDEVCEMHYRACHSFGDSNPDCLPGTCVAKKGIFHSKMNSWAN